MLERELTPLSRWRFYPRGLLALALATFVLFLARGMILPFLVIYFAQVVGLGEALVGAGIALSSAVGVGATLALASTIDRYGARRVLLYALLALAVVHATLWLGQEPLVFLVLMCAFGISVNVYWPASDTLATAFLPPTRAGEVFALQRLANAFGLGIGGLLGGLLVSDGKLTAYRSLFLLSAAGVLLAAVLVTLLVPPAHCGHRTASSRGRTGWARVLGNRRFLASQVVLLLAVAGFTQFQVSVPPFLRSEADFSERAIGLLFALNMLVVGAQVPVARWIGKTPLAYLFAGTGLGWALAYTVIALAPKEPFLAFLGALLYSVAELLFVPAAGAVVIALADPEHRARYLAFSSVVWAIGWGGSAWIAGTLLERGTSLTLWGGTIVMMVGMSLLAWGFARWLEPRPLSLSFVDEEVGTDGG
ncbi:Multidrug resistance protein MdtH [bacterium HR28]|nr:Multidrug resistance protein MdtH [bacterium HR28]